jgi:hypothetical protein
MDTQWHIPTGTIFNRAKNIVVGAYLFWQITQQSYGF